MGRRLNTTLVIPTPPGSGDAGFVVLGPDDEVPGWALEHVGDHAWADDEAAVSVHPNDPANRPRPVPPAKAGATGSKAAWLEYAAMHDVAIPEDVTRDGIIAALDAAGIPTE